MSEKELKVRIQQKHDVEANWIKATGFIPKAGEIIVYDADTIHPQSRLKVGDGATAVNNLDFVDSTNAGMIDINLKDVVEGELNLINADTLDGKLAEQYVLKTELSKLINNNSEKIGIELTSYLNSIHSPNQLSANEETNSDFNLHTFADFGSGFHSYFDDLLKKYPHYLVREHLGKDSSDTLDMYRYTLGKHYWSAWYKEGYPRMYAWKNGDTVIYSESVAPRIGDVMYKTEYIGETYGTQNGGTSETVTVPGKAVIVRGWRFSHSGGDWVEQADAAALVVPVEFAYDSSIGHANRHIVELTNATFHSTYTGCKIGDDGISFPRSGSFTRNDQRTKGEISPGGSVDYGKKYAVVFLTYNGSQTFANTTVTLDGVKLNVIVSDDVADSVKASHATIQSGGTITVAVPGKAVLLPGYRYSHSGQSWSTEPDCAALVFPVTHILGSSTSQFTRPVMTLTNAVRDSYYSGYYLSTTLTNFPGKGATIWNEETYDTVTLITEGAAYSGDVYGMIFLERHNSEAFENTAVSIDGVPLDIIVTYDTADISLVAHATNKEVEVEDEQTTATVTAVSATNRSRTINGLEFVRYVDGDIEPTLYYTAAYNPYNHLVDINENWENGQFTIDGNILTGYDKKPLRYIRYPFGDLTKDKKPLIHMTIITNEHGGDGEPAIPTVIAARLIRDLCNGQCSSDNPVYRYLRDNVQITFIPGVNPHGLNKYASGIWDGYHNVNNVNINRNYDTPGWDYCYEHQDIDNNQHLGPYPGSENETQYVMNTMVDSKAQVAMSVHTLSCNGSGNRTKCMYQGQNPNGAFTQAKIEEIADDMKASYNLDFIAYNPLECPPDTTSKSPSFITQIGAYGGIVEMQCHEPFATDEETANRTTMFTDTVMEQNYSLLLKFITMWISDYLEQV